MNRVIKISEVKDLTTLSNATIYRLIKLGEFPKQLKLAETRSDRLFHEREMLVEQVTEVK